MGMANSTRRGHSGRGYGPQVFVFEGSRGTSSVSVRRRRIQDPPVKHDLYLTLDDITRGCTKKMKISRLVLQPNGFPRKEDKVLIVNVKPGWKAGTTITFKKEGDQFRNKIPADIVFTVRDKPHTLFQREGSDIRYTAKITLKQAICGTIISVPTLTAHNIPIDLNNEVVKPSTVKRIQGHGLPIPNEPGRRGDLLVSFDIEFPEFMTQSVKNVVYDTLPN